MPTDQEKIADAENMHQDYLDALETVTNRLLDKDDANLGGVAAAILLSAESMIDYVLKAIDPLAPHAEIGYDAVDKSLTSMREHLDVCRVMAQTKTLTGSVVYRSE